MAGSSSTSGVTYAWTGPGSFTSTVQNPSVSTAGTYNLTVTNPTNGCSSTTTATVATNNTAPGATATGGTITCSATAVTLTGSSSTSGVTYAWTGPGSFTSTAQNPSVSTAGTYNLTVTNPTNGCSSTTTATVATNNTAPGASATGGTLTCSVTTVTLAGSSSTSGVTYAWTGPGSFTSTAQNPSVSTAGTYNLTVTNPTNGCSSTTTATVATNNTAPGASASGGTITCASTAVTLAGSSPTSGVTYAWTGPGSFTSTAQNPSVSTAGTYNLTVRNPTNGCSSIATGTVATNNTAPGASATGGTLTCSVTTVTLAGSSSTFGVTYAWTGPGSFTSTAQNPSVSTAGTYNLTVTNPTNGCSSTTTATVATNNTAPGASASGGTITCASTAVTLAGSSPTSGVTYAWTGPGSFTSTAQNPSVSTAGTYNLTVTNPTNGCSSTATATVATNNTAPGASATGGTLTCSVTTVTLAGSSSTSGVTYAWTGPGSFTSTAQNPSVNTAGTYNLTVKNLANGCNSSATAIVSSNISLPGASASVSGSLTCGTTSVSLLGSSPTSGVTYRWSGPLVFTSTEQNPVTTHDGNYTVTVTNPSNGCASTSSIVVTQDTVKATGVKASVSGTINCTNTSVSLAGTSTTSSVSYSWSGPGGYSSNSQNPVVSVPGNYILSVSKLSNGCIATDAAIVVLDTIKPRVVIASSGILSCTANTVTLTVSSATAGLHYDWSGPNFTATGAVANVTNPGDYFVTATNPGNNCISLFTSHVVKDLTPPSAVTVSISGTLKCNSPTISLTASSTTPGVVYNWTGPGNFSSNEASPNVNLPGVYSVTVTNPYNECGVSKTAEVQQDTLKPAAVQATVNGSLNCRSNTVVLNGFSTTPGVTYNWEGPGGFSSSIQQPGVTNPGIYTLTVTLPSNGCKVIKQVQVSQDIAAPANIGASVSGPITCTDEVVVLSASPSNPSYDYYWSGPGVDSPGDQAIASFPGQYKLVVSNPLNYCKDSVTITVVEDKVYPVSQIISPSGSPIALTANTISAQAVANASYSWGISSSNTNWIIISGANNQALTYQSGDAGSNAIFALTVTGNLNGCSSTSQVTLTSVSALKKLPIAITGVGKQDTVFQYNSYPNPFTDKAVIDFTPPRDSHVEIKLYSASGEMMQVLFDDNVQAHQLYQAIVDNKRLHAGTYYYIIHVNSQAYVQKLIFIQ
jgi:hypothetical protein